MGVERNRGGWILNLNKSLYGLKQAKCKLVWYSKNDLERRGYYQSQVESCVFYIKIISYFNVCWWSCNSLTQTRYNHIIN